MGSSALPLIICLLFFTPSALTNNSDNSHGEGDTGNDAAHNQAITNESHGEDGTGKDAAEAVVEEGLSVKPVVKVSPDQRVFTGETVTLTCDIQTGGNIQWTYSWFRDGRTYYPYRTTAELSFTADSESVSVQYSCRGERSDLQRSSDISDDVTLTISALPRSTLTVTPASPVFTGETVNLKCVIKSDHSDWTYEWYKDRNSVKLQSFDHHTVDRDTLTIKDVKSDQGQYWCKGQRSGRPNSSQSSSAVYLSVDALPRSTVSVTPASAIFTGETVNLKCGIELYYSGWTYQWYKDSKQLRSSDHHTVNRDTLTIRGAAESDKGLYLCEGQRSERPKSTQSSSVLLSVKALPIPTLTVTPASPVFTGETVSLKCEIKVYWYWRYEWYKGNSYKEKVKLKLPDGLHAVNGGTLTISGAAVPDQGQYWCEGQRSGRPNSSQSSSAVSLTVVARPTPVVSVSPDQRVFTGETVTLTCDIQTGGNIQWTYSWFRNGHTYYSYTTTKTTTVVLTLTANSKTQYSCRGERSDLQRSSHTSAAVTLTVSALPIPTMSVTPASPVFTGETVNLKCVIESDHTNWRYQWYKDNSALSLSTYHTVKGNTLTISEAVDTDGGSYRCNGFIYGRLIDGRTVSSYISSAVSLSVKKRPKPEVKVSPDQRVFTGETVTLTCDIQTGGNIQWTYSWFRDGHTHYPYRTTSTAELSFTADSESVSGQYSCRGERSDSERSSYSSDAVTLTVSDSKPTAELRSDPAGAALTGNTVTLTCDIDLSTGWDFYWYKNTLDSETKKTEKTNSYRVKIDSVSDGGQYWCRAGRGKPVYYTQYSHQLWINVTESPKAVVTVRPDEHVFRGETVTLRCDIKWGENTKWTYRWQIEETDQYKLNHFQYNYNYRHNYNQYNQHENTVSQSSAQELKISHVDVFHNGKYSCTGLMDTQSSQSSDAVTLTVSSDEAQAAVRVSPQAWITEGHSVTLICEVTGSSTGWTFSWFRDADHLSDSSRGAGGSYTLSPAALQHTGVYTCRAERGEPAYYSHNSSSQTLWVTGVSPTMLLVLRPSRSQHFSSDSLSLSCDSAGWTVRRYTDKNTEDCSAQTGSTCEIRSLSTSDSGVYWCQSESGEKRHPLNITVHDGAVILGSSVEPVIEGETLTLHCLHRSTNSSILTADFYKDGSLIQNQTGEMSIPTVSKSDEGFYYCKIEREESPRSWISIRASSSFFPLVTGVAVGLSVCALFLILLVLLLLRHKKKDQHGNVQQSLSPRRSGGSQLENSSLYSGSDHIYDDVTTVKNTDDEPVGDVTYSEVTVKKNITVDQDEPMPGQSHVMYSEVGTKVKKLKNKDVNTAGPSDMTYSQINIKDEKKNKGKGAGPDVLIEMKSKEKRRGKSSESGDTLYSELKHTTDKGADAGGDATYAQVLTKKKKKTRL